MHNNIVPVWLMAQLSSVCRFPYHRAEAAHSSDNCPLPPAGQKSSVLTHAGSLGRKMYLNLSHKYWGVQSAVCVSEIVSKFECLGW